MLYAYSECMLITYVEKHVISLYIAVANSQIFSTVTMAAKK